MNTSILATLGPKGSDAHQAALRYEPEREPLLFDHVGAAIEAVTAGSAHAALVPVYNTRVGEIKEYFRLITRLSGYFWMDNIVLPIHLSLGGLEEECPFAGMRVVIGRSSVLRQCDDYIARHMPQATLVSVQDIDGAAERLKEQADPSQVLIETEAIINRHGLRLIDRELAPHNRTRFAIIGAAPHEQTGYDATSVISKPLPDRVGLLVDTLNEFTRRGINILDLRSENDIETQKLQIYLEVEGHRDDPLVTEALTNIERSVIQEPDCIRILGSFPRVDMRVKKIKTFGFIGTGEMSTWFADKLQGEGYETLITGRTSEMRPEEMLDRVEVVIVCVPISVTAEVVRTYGARLGDGQALIILAGESETPLEAALAATPESVEVMLVHNLWGPRALTMKDKNVAVVRTRRSGSLCDEFESFLYKYGAEINQDSAAQHDLMMGVSQKLPTAISVALAMTLLEHDIGFADIDAHSTLTSLYGVLAMARAHGQNPRTYAEIMATGGEGRKIVASFIANLQTISELADGRRIDQLAEIIDRNRAGMPPAFLKTKMSQAQAVDAVLSDIGFKGA